jgi:D-alanyl-D-alanine carboxypeptidase
VWLIGTALLAITVQTLVTTMRVAQPQGGYQTASAPSEGAIVAVRFAAQASMADVGKFLDEYQASLAGGPQPGNLYRLRIGDTALPPEELSKILGQMSQETVVKFAAAVQ